MGLQTLLAAGAQPDCPNVCNRTPLMEATELGDPQMCEALLCAGADPFARDPRTNSSVAQLASKSSELMAVFRSFMGERSGLDAELPTLAQAGPIRQTQCQRSKSPPSDAERSTSESS